MPAPDLDALAEDFNVIWGAESIGKVIGLSRRQVFHLLETGQLNGAKKVASRWCITRQNLMANFEPDAGGGHALGGRQRAEREALRE